MPCLKYLARGFEFPQIVDYDEELHILELSIVSPPYILDFVEVGLGKRPPNFDLDRIETQQSKRASITLDALDSKDCRKTGYDPTSL